MDVLTVHQFINLLCLLFFGLFFRLSARLQWICATSWGHIWDSHYSTNRSLGIPHLRSFCNYVYALHHIYIHKISNNKKTAWRHYSSYFHKWFNHVLALDHFQWICSDIRCRTWSRWRILLDKCVFLYCSRNIRIPLQLLFLLVHNFCYQE